ncbi:hypothetical protein Bca4012_072879 [Brassica carinata]
MAHSDSPSGDESPSTDAAPTAAAFKDIILEIMAQQDAIQKATNEQLATIAAILAPLAENSADTATTRRDHGKYKHHPNVNTWRSRSHNYPETCRA